MPKRVILHVGMPKTGTSSLQRAFASHSDLLAAADIAYVLPSDRDEAHHSLIEAVAEQDSSSVRNFFDRARAHFDRAEQVLISSESMCNLRGDELAWWKACLDRQFGNPEYAIWMFARRPSTHIPSKWHAFIRRCGRQNLPAFAFDATMRMLRANRLPLQAAFDRYEGVFDRSSIRLVTMEKLVATGDLVAAAFKTMFGIDSDEVRDLPRRNPSLEPGAAELLRAFTLRCGEDDWERTRSLLRSVMRMLRKGDNVFTDLVRRFEPFIGEITINDRSPAFMAMEERALAHIGDRVDAWGDGTIFGSEGPRAARYTRDEYWFDERILRQLNEAYPIACKLADKAKRKPRPTKLNNDLDF